MHAHSSLIHKIVTMALASMVTVALSVVGFGAATANAANGVQPVTFSVTAGSLTIAQIPSTAIALVPDTAIALPVTTITDGRNDVARSGNWNATSVASDLTESGGGVIAATNIAMAQTGTFTGGSGVDDNTIGGTVAVTADSIGSVYAYTPTAELTVPANPNSGSYTGTVTQTVL